MSLIFATKLWVPSRATAVLTENLWYQLVYDAAIMTGVALIWPLVLASVIRSYNAHSPAASQSARDESHRHAFVYVVFNSFPFHPPKSTHTHTHTHTATHSNHLTSRMDLQKDQ